MATDVKGFISDEEMAALESAQSQSPEIISDEQMAQLEAQSQRPDWLGFLESAGKGISFGHLPGFQAIAEPAMTAGLNVLTGQQVEAPSIAQAEAENRARQESFAKEHPYLDITGQLIGGGLTAPVMGPVLGAVAAPIKGVGLGAQAARMAAQGAFTGAISDTGPTPKNVEDQALAKLQAIGTGAIAGPVVGMAAKGIATGLSKSKEAIGAATTKALSSLSAVPEQNIKTLANKPEAVNAVIQNSSGDVQAAAHEFQDSVIESLRLKRRQLSNQLGQALSGKGGDAETNVLPMVKAVEAATGRVNAKLQPEVVQEMEDLARKLRSLGDPRNGQTTVRELHDATRYLQSVAEYSEMGKVFQRNDPLGMAARSAAAQARQQVAKAGPPTIRRVNKQLSGLHELEDSVNPQLINSDKPTGAVFSAGAGQNTDARRDLEKLGKVLGRDLVGESEVISAARTFANAPLLPMDTTGKSALRTGIATGIGSLLGGPAGAVAGGAASSPRVQQALIEGSKPLRDLINRIPVEQLGKIPPQVFDAIAAQSGGLSSRKIKRLKALEQK